MSSTRDSTKKKYSKSEPINPDCFIHFQARLDKDTQVYPRLLCLEICVG